jgi:hypothetical protein
MTRVRDVFEVSYGHSLELNRLTRSSAADAVNFVSRTAKNNGVSARVERIQGVEPAPGGLVSVALGGTVLETFLQPTPFYCGRDVAILAPILTMSLAQRLWWVAAIRANRYRYNYGRQANRTLADLELPDVLPDFVGTAIVPDYTAVRAAASNDPVPDLDASSWRAFPYDDLFNFERGERVINRELQPGSTPYVRASERRNGIVVFGDLPLRHRAGAITVPYNGNSVGKAFYQPRPFFASDDVIVLVPKRHLTPAAAHFLCALIRAERFRFSYGRKWNMERMTQAVMRLPITSEGEPDWTFMERFVLSLPYSSSIGG